jgi:hypothetical protein
MARKIRGTASLVQHFLLDTLCTLAYLASVTAKAVYVRLHKRILDRIAYVGPKLLRFHEYGLFTITQSSILRVAIEAGLDVLEQRVMQSREKK